MKKRLFSKDEMEILNDYNELFRGVTLNERSVNCFDVLLGMINDNISEEELSKSELLALYWQIKQSHSYLERVHWNDGSELNSMLPKIGRYILNIIDRQAVCEKSA